MSGINRREFTAAALGLSALGTLGAPGLIAAASGPLERKIPSSGEAIPAIGVGTVRYGVDESAASRAPLVAALERFHALGGRVVDTAPMYRTSETVLGDLIASLGIRDDLFIATKVDRDDRRASTEQMESSLEKLRVERFDLMQVHNLIGWQDNVPLVAEWKAAGKVRYTGITTHRESQYAEMERIVEAHELDFIQINYSLEQRESAERMLPLAADRGVGVIINRAFGGGRLFNAVGEQPLPDWAAEFDCSSWAQFMLKYVLSHPAVTVVIPGMTKARHVDDNMGAGQGRLPDATERRRMEAWFDAL